MQRNMTSCGDGPKKAPEMLPESIVTSGAELTCAVAGMHESTHSIENPKQDLSIGIKEVASLQKGLNSG